MFLIRLLRLIKGYVKFTATGVFVERFLNLAARRRIPIWGGTKRGERFTGFTAANTYRLLHEPARKSGVRIKVLEKYGLPFRSRRYRKRKGLLTGAIVFFLFLGVMNNFIWSIEVNGNETVSSERILRTLGAEGVKVGSFSRAIDIRYVEKKMLLELPELSWLALNMDGSTIRVEVHEAEPKPEQIDPKTPCNVVSTGTGRIVSINTYEGQAAVAVGDTVLTGDILVSGIMEDSLGQNSFRHARADVVAEIQDTIMVKAPLKTIQAFETGEIVRRNSLQILGLKLPLYIPTAIEKPYSAERQNSQASLFAVKLPIWVWSEAYTLMEEKEVIYTEEEAKELVLRELTAIEHIRFGEGQILEKTAQGSVNGEDFVLTVEYLCLMNIGRQSEIRIDEGGPSPDNVTVEKE